MADNRLRQRVFDDVEKYNGIRRMRKTGMLKRLLVRRMRCDKLHVNPADEFCHRDVGPSDRILSEYGKMIQDSNRTGQPIYEERVIIEKMSPDGYMLLNGHHRWGAAIQMGVRRIRVKIVNVTHEEDVERMINRGKNNKRASFDLDEVLIGNDPAWERDTPDLFGRLFGKQRLRRGAASLIDMLHREGYDVWVYTSGYLSEEEIKRFFLSYRIRVEGIINGLRKDTSKAWEANSDIRKKIAEKYQFSLHVDNESIIWTDSLLKTYDVIPLNTDAGHWSASVIEYIGKLPKRN